MQANDPVGALANCKVVTVLDRGSDARRACSMPMRLDPARIKPPQ